MQTAEPEDDGVGGALGFKGGVWRGLNEFGGKNYVAGIVDC